MPPGVAAAHQHFQIRVAHFILPVMHQQKHAGNGAVTSALGAEMGTALATPLTGAPPAAAGEGRQALELPDDGQLEQWRSMADELLQMRAGTVNLAKIRSAALQLQNAYLFGAQARAALQPSGKVDLASEDSDAACLLALIDLQREQVRASSDTAYCPSSDAQRAALRSITKTFGAMESIVRRLPSAPAAPVTELVNADFTDTARAALAWVLWHHQGGSSPVGQPIRFALGMGADERLGDARIEAAQRWAGLNGWTTEKVHKYHPPAREVGSGANMEGEAQ